MCVVMRALGHHSGVATSYTERVAKLFAVWKLQIQPVTDLCKTPVRYWWPTGSCC